VLAAILRAVPVEMQAGLAVKETAKKAWEAIRSVRVGVDRVKEANAEKLRKEFNELRFKAGEGVEDFSLRLNTLANQLRVLGENVSEKDVVKRLLHSVPENLEQIALSMETLLDLSTISIEEATGRLRAVEQRKKTAQALLDAGRLLLTKEEWLARLKNQGASGDSSHGRRGGGGGRGRGRGRSRGRGGGEVGSCEGRDESENKFGPKPGDVCNRCGKKGHWAWECRQREKAKANLVQEEEGALNMVTAVEITARSSGCSKGKKTVVKHIQLEEEKVFV
jgi:hypothetical protein